METLESILHTLTSYISRIIYVHMVIMPAKRAWDDHIMYNNIMNSTLRGYYGAQEQHSMCVTARLRLMTMLGVW